MRTNVPGVRTLVFVFFLSLICHRSNSQSIITGNGKYEVGFGIGPLVFLGDLGGNFGEGKTFLKDVNIPLTKVAKGVYASLYPAEWIGFRVALNQGMLEGDDSQIEDKGGAERFRKDRNLKFRSSIIEAYAATEFYPTVFFERYDELKGKLRPYGIAGVGMVKFNPKGEYTNSQGIKEWVALQPLSLEGQGMEEYPTRNPYKLSAMEIPMGFGAKYYIKDNMFIGMEVLHRKTNTDYMDDVSKTYINENLFDKYLTPAQATMAKQLHYRELSAVSRPQTNVDGEQRGDPKQNDAFFSTILKFGWRLNDWNSPNGRAARQMRCPSFY